MRPVAASLCHHSAAKGPGSKVFRPSHVFRLLGDSYTAGECRRRPLTMEQLTTLDAGFLEAKIPIGA